MAQSLAALVQPRVQSHARRNESRSGIEPRFFCLPANAIPLGQTGSLAPGRVTEAGHNYIPQSWRSAVPIPWPPCQTGSAGCTCSWSSHHASLQGQISVTIDFCSLATKLWIYRYSLAGHLQIHYRLLSGWFEQKVAAFGIFRFISDND